MQSDKREENGLSSASSFPVGHRFYILNVVYPKVNALGRANQNQPEEAPHPLPIPHTPALALAVF